MILETLFAQTLTTYLQTPEAVAAGLPTEPAVHYLAAHEKGDKQRPLITVKVERSNQTHPELAVLVCTFTLEINVASNGATGTGFTDPALAETWIRALRSHLGNKTNMAAHLNALSLADRTGWQVLDHYLPPHYKPEIDAAEQSREYEQGLQLTLRVTPPM